MKSLIFFSLIIVSLSSLAQQGSLDTSFNHSGFTLTDFNGTYDGITAIKSILNDEILVCGYAYNSSDMDFALAKYMKNGSLHQTFGTNGLFTLDVSSSDDLLYAIGTQSTGKIIAGGTTNRYGNYDLVLIRLDQNGTLDTSFGSQGITVVRLNSKEIGKDLVVLSDDKIVLSGYNDTTYMCVKFNADGSIDNAFGSSGISTIYLSPSKIACGGLVVQKDGKIVITGDHYNYDYFFATIRLNADGSLDNSFDLDGISLIPGADSSQSSEGFAVDLQDDGMLILAGRKEDTSGYSAEVIRVKTDGSIDTSFGANGRSVINQSVNDRAHDVKIQKDGKILVISNTEISGNMYMMTSRLNNDGILDTAFGNSGSVIFNPSHTHNSIAYDIDIQSDGNILVAGTYYTPASDADFIVVRYTGDRIVGTKDLSLSNKQIRIFPNPVESAIYAILDFEQSKNITIQLFDLSGKHLSTPIKNRTVQGGRQEVKIQIPNNLTSNSYYILSLSDEVNKYTIRFLKK